MRFTCIAIIFQGASICTKILATYHSSHIHEAKKVFKCDGYNIAQWGYSRSEWEEFWDDDTRATLYEKHGELVTNFQDTRVVQFYDEDNGGYKYFDLTTEWLRYETELHTIDVQHIIAIDRQGRACAMIMRKTMYRIGFWCKEIPRITYELCEIEP